MWDQRTRSVALTLAVTLASFSILAPEARAQAGSGVGTSDSFERSRFDAPSQLDVADVALGVAILRLESLSGIPIAFSPTLLPIERSVSCDCEELGIRAALAELLSGTGFEAVVVFDQLLIRQRTPPPLDAAIDEPPEEEEPPVLVAEDTVGLPPLNDPEPRLGLLVGSVTEPGGRAPLTGAQVEIPALGLGAVSGQDGRFVITDVPPGTHRLVASLLGRRTDRAQVDVTAARTSEVTLELPMDALELDAVVVTGTPGGTQLRALGNVVGRVDAATATTLGHVQNMQDLLVGREPGLTFYGSDGTVGSGRAIRIRGISSLSMSQQPLIYVDGIRVDNDFQLGPEALRATSASRLNDFNPNEVETVEIIKGPAAATLYGTEASAGVIQIITKRGEAGAPRFDLAVRQGGNWLGDAARKVGDAYGIDPQTGDLLRFNVIEQEKAAGRPVFTVGHVQDYNLSVRGGTELARYFLSSDWQSEVGMVDYNWDRRFSHRANLSLVPREDLAIDVSAGYVDGLTSFMSQTRYDVWYSVRMSTPLTLDTRDRGFFRSPPEVSRTLEATRKYRHFTGSVTLQHDPTPWLSQRLTVGMDRTSDRNVFLAPRQEEPEGHWFGGLAFGEKEVELPRSSTATLDYAASVGYSLGETVSFSTSVGAQYYRYRYDALLSEGSEFPSPGVTTLSGLAEVHTTDETMENVSMGLYLQQEMGWRERLFLTAAIRGDDNSAFGSSYDAAIYPKLSATWVVTEEDFWPSSDWLSSLRLRSAWGQAGRQPSSFAGVTLYSPTVALEGESAVRPSVLGNPDVGPEVSTELEVGFDFAMLNDRLSGDFTYFTQEVADALVEVPVISSTGFPGIQDQNLASLSNWGWELSLSARLIERETTSLDMGLSFASARNRIDDMGGVSETDVLQEGFHFPAAFYVTPDFGSGELDGQGNPIGVLCDYGRNVVDGYGLRGGEWKPCVGGEVPPPRLYWGPLGSPQNQASLDFLLGLGSSVTVYATGEWRGFHRIEGNDPLCRFFCYPNDRYAVERRVPVVLCATDSGSLCGGGDVGRTIHGANASFAKLREISLTYRLPERWLSATGVSDASVTVAGRDLLTWQAQKCTPDNIPGYSECYGGTTVADPETRDPRQVLTGGNPAGGGVTAVPGLSSVVVTMRVSF